MRRRARLVLEAEAHLVEACRATTRGEPLLLLGLSPMVVERHRAELGLEDRLELTRYAIRAGLIEP
ncbi:hypothetical protein ACIQU3_05040 [Streptomyces sp. NPDC101110]|uniref:hypothetical protein n=1 Tax=unclassified Streptomyces TaxID=2593676 RepID=UPI0038082ADD